MTPNRSGESAELTAIREKVDLCVGKLDLHDRILRGGPDGGGVLTALDRNTQALEEVKRVIRQADLDRKAAEQDRKNDRRMVFGSFISAGLAAVAAVASWAWKQLPHQP